MARSFARGGYAALWAGWWLLALGCGSSTAPLTSTVPATTAGVQAAPLDDPRELVHQTIARYREALAYSDSGVIRLSYVHDGAPLEDSAPLAVDYSLPNRLRVRAYTAEIVCDGDKLWGRIQDEATQNLDRQILRRAAPAKLSLDELYSDGVVQNVVLNGLGRHPVQLELLLGDAPLVDLLKPETKLTLLSPVEISGRACYRLEAKLADGPYIFWIDRESLILRRIEYPAAGMIPDLAATPGVTQLKLVADFRGAKFSESLPESTFQFTAPADAKFVRQLVLPPQALPTELFGKKPGDFTLTTADGETVTPAGLAGKYVVLAWFTHDPACAPTLQQLSQSVAESKAGERLAAYVIATEDQSLASDKIAATLKEWKVELPLARDFKLAGRDVFGIRNAPTLVILDPEGRLQIFEEGANPRLAQTLPVVLERLLAGEDLAAEILADAKQAREQYAQSLVSLSGDAAPAATVLDLQDAAPAPVREPEHFTRTRLWSLEKKELAEPGNILIATDKPGAPRILALDGWRTVVELDAEGKVRQRFPLPLPDQAGVSFLRTAVDKQGKRTFAASALLAKQLFIFDDAFQLTASYPPAEQTHDGIHAVEMADLDDDGTPEIYVGFWSLLGVHSLNLKGEHQWRNRVVPTVLSLVATVPNDLGWRKLLATSDRGGLYRLNQYGHQDPKIEVAGRQVHRLTAGKFKQPLDTAYVGISYPHDGRLLALGLSADLEEVWNHRLPAGQFNNQMEYVTAGHLRSDDQGEWILAGPDGSVHIISTDGEFSDSFAVGELLTGLAFAQLGGDRVILTATKTKLTAWKLDPR